MTSTRLSTFRTNPVSLVVRHTVFSPHISILTLTTSALREPPTTVHLSEGHSHRFYCRLSVRHRSVFCPTTLAGDTRCCWFMIDPLSNSRIIQSNALSYSKPLRSLDSQGPTRLGRARGRAYVCPLNLQTMWLNPVPASKQIPNTKSSRDTFRHLSPALLQPTTSCWKGRDAGHVDAAAASRCVSCLSNDQMCHYRHHHRYH